MNLKLLLPHQKMMTLLKIPIQKVIQEIEGGVVGLVDYLGNNLMGRWTRPTCSSWSMPRSTSGRRWYTTSRPRREWRLPVLSKLLVMGILLN